MRKSSRPLRTVNLNLFADDVETMERRYGRGWTEQVRELVNDHIGKYKKGYALMDEVSDSFLYGEDNGE